MPVRAVLLAFGQLADPEFRRPLWRGMAVGAVCFGVLLWLALHAAGRLAEAAPDWLGGPVLDWAVQVLGGVLALLVAGWLFVPVLVMLASLFVEPVAAAVERRHYPHLPPPTGGAPVAAQAASSLGLGVRLLLLHLVLLPLALLLPGLGTALAFLVGAWGLGNGLFEGVAQRRMGVAESRALRRRRWLPVLGLGALGVAVAGIPLLNLLVPVLGAAAATHLLHQPGTGGQADGYDS